MTYPGDFCCTLFSEQYLRGEQLTLCHDGDGTTAEISLAGEDLDKRMSSYYCGKNVAYDFCADGNECYITGAGYHMMKGLHSDRAEDHASFVKLHPYDASIMGAVTVFVHPNCTGHASRFYWDPNDPGEGMYNANDLYEHWLEGNTASSILVPYGYTAIWYDKWAWRSPNWFAKGMYTNYKT